MSWRGSRPLIVMFSAAFLALAMAPLPAFASTPLSIGVSANILTKGAARPSAFLGVNAPSFWTSVATFFKSDPAVRFYLYIEPHDVTWACWLNGCTSPGSQTAGMQSLVTAVRATGATQPIMLGGLAWSNDLSGWSANRPSDPANALVVSFHNYNFNVCDPTCWNTTVAPLAAQVPVVTGELGESDCAHAYIDPYMA